MALTLPPNFASDIQGRDTALVPVIRIGDIYISTNSMTYDTNPILPLLTSNPSLKESIDIEKRNYKISNITITVNNYAYEGQRFSERVVGSLINTPVEVYWTSPSTTNFSDDTSAFMIYQGEVRRYEHDDESCKITVEDSSQATLHRDLPLPEHYLTGDEVPDKYKNKPIPMVYGEVDRSPCLVSNAEDTDDDTIVKKIIAESSDIKFAEVDPVDVGGAEIKQYPLYIFEDHYLSLNQYKEQIETDPNKYYVMVGGTISFLDTVIGIAKNTLNTWNVPEILKTTPIFNSNSIDDDIRYFDSNNPSQSAGGSWGNGWGQWGAGIEPNWGLLTDNDDSTYIQIYGYQLEDSTYNWFGDDDNTYAAIKFDLKIIQGFDPEFISTYLLVKIHNDSVAGTSGTIDQTWIYEYGTHGWDHEFNAQLVLAPTSDSINTLGTPPSKNTPMIGNSQEDFSPLTSDIYYVSVPGASGTGLVTLTADIKIYGFYFWQDIIIDRLSERDFYANVIGREIYVESDPLSASGNPRAPQMQILDIVINELGHDMFYDATLHPGVPTDIKTDFTIDKKINSKKLIENIASVTPYIPRFNNMGEFKFDEIKETYDSGDLAIAEGNETIKESDVISYSFKRTKIEDVKTKVQFFYNWDYARGDFNSNVSEKVDDSWEGFNYYGLKDHSESTLLIDDDRGKYIRDHDTAKAFTDWMLLWGINQHLIIKLKLPLGKGLNLEIGDVIEFDKVLGDVKPYGIDYTNPDPLNGQDIFPFFMITSTNKTLEFCQLECIMLHDLGISTDEGYEGMFEEITFPTDDVTVDGFSLAIASSELDGITTTDMWSIFPELINLIAIITEDGIESAIYMNGVWVGSLQSFTAGAAYWLQFNQETTTDLFYLAP